MDPTNTIQGVALLGSSNSVDHAMMTSDIEGMLHLGLAGECWVVGEVLNNDQYLQQSLVFTVSS